MPLLDLLLAMFWFFLFILWIWLFITIVVDVFRSDDLSGWGKAGWVLLLIILPLLGVLIYVIARGNKMNERAIDDAKKREAATQAYIRDAAGGASTADELEKLGRLRDDGTLTDEEYAAQKAKLLA